MIRILIADDHAVVRRGLRQTVSEEHDMTVVGEASNAQELLGLVRKQPCDVVVLDISMPGRSGLDVLVELHREYTRLPVLVLSMHSEDQYAMRALRIGAAGYLTKETAPEELVKAIRKVVTGGKYITPSLAEKLALGLGKDSEQPLHETLSEREYEVMCLIASGKSVTDISTELSLSVKTISTYRARILEKMNLKNNAELMHYAIHNRLVD
jgi:two-component system, NarL family, invasion response regulator UvrY